MAVAREDVLSVHAAPGTDRAYMSLDATNPWGQRLRLLVIRGTTDDAGDIWLRIQLPIWPNGQAGWVAASDVRLAETAERLVIDLSERRLVRLREGRPVARVRVAVGTAATPTPPGRYFVWAKVDTDRPSGPYGNFILGLSGFSDAIEPWSEWPGQPRLANPRDRRPERHGSGREQGLRSRPERAAATSHRPAARYSGHDHALTSQAKARSRRGRAQPRLGPSARRALRATSRGNVHAAESAASRRDRSCKRRRVPPRA